MFDNLSKMLNIIQIDIIYLHKNVIKLDAGDPSSESEHI